MPRKCSRPTPAIFYGYPVELIRDWCQVSRQTAYLYKAGIRKPSRQALRLFVLHRDGRVLDDSWNGWKVHKGKLISPEGQETSHGQLNAYWLIIQLAHDLSAKDPTPRKEYHKLLRSA